MDYLGSVDVNLSYQSATANSANVNSYVNTNLSLDQGKASVDSMARDESGNYARVVALAGPSAWIGTTQTVSIDPTSTSATMDIFGTSRDESGSNRMLRTQSPYLSAYSGSGNTLWQYFSAIHDIKRLLEYRRSRWGCNEWVYSPE